MIVYLSGLAVILLVAAIGFWTFSRRNGRAATKPAELRYVAHDSAALVALQGEIADIRRSVGELNLLAQGFSERLRRLELGQGRSAAPPATRPTEPPSANAIPWLPAGAAPAPVGRPISNAQPPILDAALQALQLLIATPSTDQRDRMIAQFKTISGLNDRLEPVPPVDGVYWLLPIDGDEQHALLPGYSVVRDWHSYKGNELAQQPLKRFFDLDPGSVLRIVESAFVAAGDPSDIRARGRLEGA